MSKKTFVNPNSSGGEAFEEPERVGIEAEPLSPSHRDVSVSFADQATGDNDIAVADVATRADQETIDPGCNGDKAKCTGERSTEAVSPNLQDSDLAEAVRLVSSIEPLVRQAEAHVQHWLATKEGLVGDGRYVIAEQTGRLIAIASALTQHIPMLNAHRGVHYFRRLDHDASRAMDLIETETAYDADRLRRLDARDIRDATKFDTELKDTFGLASMDEELRNPLCDALSRLLDNLEDGSSTVPGMVVMSIKALLKGHPRGFGRYYSGKDPWPRSPAVVQTEIDERMPDALRWLRYELQEAHEQEASLANSAGGGPITDEQRSRCVSKVAMKEETETRAIPCINDPEVQKDLPPPARYLPIEADEARRQLIAADSTIDPEHLDTLDGLKLLLTSDAEKTRVFCGGLDREGRAILDDLLEVAIREIEVEHATVVGVVNVLILRMLDICGELRGNGVHD